MAGESGLTNVKERARHELRARPDVCHLDHQAGAAEEVGSFPRHFGARLVAARQRAGRPLWMMASRSDGTFTLRDLREAEAGQLRLDEATTQRLAHLYGVKVRDTLASTAPELTAGERSLCIAGVAAEFEPDDARSVLSAYLEIVRTLRSIDDEALVGYRQSDLREMARAFGGSDRSTRVLANVLAMATAEGRLVVGGLLAGATAIAAARPSPVGAGHTDTGSVIETTAADRITRCAS